MNKVILLGRVTRDIEYKPTATSGYARFTVAVDRPKTKDQQESTADFLNCVAFGKTGETIAKFFGKGRKILVEGRIQTGSYEKDGQKINTVDIMVSNFEFVESKSANTEQSSMSNFGNAVPFDEEIPF